MKNKFLSLIIAISMILTTGGTPVLAAAVPAEAPVTTEGQDAGEAQAMDGLITPAETDTGGTLPDEPETPIVEEDDPQAPTGDESETAEERDGQADLTDLTEKYAEYLELPGFSCHDGKLWYEELPLDENGCYAYTDENGNQFLYNSLDPEFLKIYQMIIGKPEIAESDDEELAEESNGFSSSLYGASAGSIYWGLNGAPYMHPNGADGRDVMNGVDVSYANGIINWTAMRNSGVQFAIIRAGARGYGSAGTRINDTYFVRNINGAAAVGIRIGIYWYSQATSVAEAEEEALWCYQNIRGYAGSISLPVYIDYEYADTPSGVGGRLYAARSRMGNAGRTAAVNAFCAKMNYYGFATGVYANKDMLLSDMTISSIPTSYSIWMANWQNVTSYPARLDCWQYAVSTALTNYTSSSTIDLDFGYFTESYTLSASASPATVTLNEAQTPYGESIVTARTNAPGATYTWVLSTTDGAKLVSGAATAQATIRFTKAGTYAATVTASAKGWKQTASVRIQVNAKMQEAWFAAGPASTTYDGTAHSLKELIQKTNKAPAGLTYDVYYEKTTVTSLTEVKRGADEEILVYQVTIVGKAPYSGTLTREVKILPRDIGGKDCEITALGTQEYVPDTSALQFYVYDNGIKTKDASGKEQPKLLTRGTDYTVKGVSALSTGNAQITILGAGNYTGTLVSKEGDAYLEPSHISADMIAAIADQTYTGEELKPTLSVTQAGVTLVAGRDYTVTYANNVNVTTAKSLAEATVSGIGNYTGTATVNFKIVPRSLSSDMLVDIPAQTYTAAAIRLNTKETPVLRNVCVTEENGDPIYLTETTNNRDGDYRIVYSANLNVGTATVTLLGLNNYKGSVRNTFQIERATLADDENVRILLANSEEYSAVYTGRVIRPAVQVRRKVVQNGVEKEIIVPATQYTVTYENNQYVGTAKVIVTSRNSYYEGAKEKTFTITPKELSVPATGRAAAGISIGNIAAQTFAATAVYEGQGMRPLPIVKYGGTALVEGTDYTIAYDRIALNEKGQVLYDTAVNEKGKTVNIGLHVEEAGLSEITRAGTYRAVLTAVTEPDAGGALKNFAGSFTYQTVFKANPAKLAAKNFVMANTALRATGDELDPKILVTVDGRELDRGAADEPGTEYTVAFVKGRETYAAPTEPGSYTVRVTGIGNFTGTVTQALRVYAADEKVLCTSDYKVLLPDGTSYLYDNTLKKPTVRVVSNGNEKEELTLNKDFTVAYTNNRNVGTATVKVTGKGAYKGTLTTDFTIEPSRDGALGELVFTLNKDSFVFNGKVQRPTPTVKLIYTDPATKKQTVRQTLKNKTDYTFAYENLNSRNAGTYHIEMTLLGNFAGREETLTYTITPYEVSKLAVAVPTQYYNGTEQEPTLSAMTIRAGGVLLTDADKEGLEIVGFTSNIAISSATNKPTVEIRARENEAGEPLGNFANDHAVTTKGVMTHSTLYKTQGFTITRRAVSAANLVPTVGGKSVNARNISEYSVTYEEEPDAKGKLVAKAQEPELRLVDTTRLDDGEPYVLTPSTDGKTGDYKITYSANKNVGKSATITITGLNGYSGTRRVTFAITGKALDEAGASAITLYTASNRATLVTEETYTYTAAQQKPVPVLSYLDKKQGPVELKNGTDYTVKYENNVNAGTAKVILTGKGRYAGTVEQEFTICPVTRAWVRVNKKTVSISKIATQTYTGKTIVPNVTVTVAGRRLTKGKDYTVNTTNTVMLTADGRATLMINGIGNYSGLLGEASFEVR